MEILVTHQIQRATLAILDTRIASNIVLKMIMPPIRQNGVTHPQRPRIQCHLGVMVDRTHPCQVAPSRHILENRYRITRQRNPCHYPQCCHRTHRKMDTHRTAWQCIPTTQRHLQAYHCYQPNHRTLRSSQAVVQVAVVQATTMARGPRVQRHR